MASFGREFLVSDFELRLSELSGVSHSQSHKWTAVSHLLCLKVSYTNSELFLHLRA